MDVCLKIYCTDSRNHETLAPYSLLPYASMLSIEVHLLYKPSILTQKKDVIIAWGSQPLFGWDGAALLNKVSFYLWKNEDVDKSSISIYFNLINPSSTTKAE